QRPKSASDGQTVRSASPKTPNSTKSASSSLLPYRRSVFPTHIYVVRQQTKEPAAAAHPAAPSFPVGIFDDHVIDRLSLRRGPEKRPREKAAVFLANDAKSILVGPLLQQRVGALESPNPREDNQAGEGQDPHDDKEIFHWRFHASGEGCATG